MVAFSFIKPCFDIFDVFFAFLEYIGTDVFKNRNKPLLIDETLL